MAISGLPRLVSAPFAPTKVEGIKWQILLWDKTFAGTPLTGVDVRDFDISWEAENDIFTEPLKPSTGEVTFTDNGNAWFANLLTALSTAQENQMYLIINKWDGSVYQLHWVGVVMTDMVNYDNAPHPRDLKIIAKDGLNRMGNFEFNKIQTTPYIVSDVSVPQTAMKIIYDCLDYAGIVDFWQANSYYSFTSYIKVNTKWKDANMICDNTSAAKQQTRSLELMRFDRDFLFDKYVDDEDDAHKYNNRINTAKKLRISGVNDPVLKTRHVLRGILQITGLRICLSNGSWYITQLATYTDVNAEYANYDNTGAYVNVTLLSLQKTPDLLTGGKFGWYPSLRTARATTMPTDIMGQVHAGQILSTDSPLYEETFDMGTIYGGTGLRLRVHLPIQGINWSSKYGDVNLLLTITVNAGTYRVIGRIPNTYDEGIMKWTTNASDVYKYKNHVNSYFSALGRKNNMFADWVVETEDIPFTSEDNCTMTVRLEITRTNGSLPAASNYKLELQNVSIAVIDSADGEYGQITEYEVVNPNLSPGNSVDSDLGKLNIHDTGIISNKVSIETDEYVGAARWTKSTVWDAQHITNTTLVQTILKEAMALQTVPIKKYTGPFRDSTTYADHYNPCNTLSYDATIWVFQSLKFNCISNEWDGTWFAINRIETYVTDDGGPTKSPTTRKKYDPMGGGNGDNAPALPMAPRPSGTQMHPHIKAEVDDYKAAAASISSITISSSNYGQIRKGDWITFIEPITGKILDEAQVTANVDYSDTSISFSSITLAEDITTGCEVIIDANELLTTNEARANNYLSLGYGNNYTYSTVLKGNTTGATPTELTTDGATGSGSDNRIKIPIDTAAIVTANIIVKEVGTANYARMTRVTSITNNGGTTIVQTTSTPFADSIAPSLAAISIAITADDTEDSYILTFTGIIATILNITAHIHVVEVTD